MKVTLKDVATQCGVSKSTVSVVLSGGKKYVSAELVERIIATSIEMGYRPNPTARSLATRRSNTIGFVPMSLAYNAFYNLFTKQVLQYVLKGALTHGTHIVIPSAYNPLDSQSSNKHLFSSAVDGFILVPPIHTSSLADLKSLGVPLVAVTAVEDSEVPCMTADNFQGGYIAGEYLKALGHTKVACLYNDERSDVNLRKIGFLAGMGVSPDSHPNIQLIKSGPNIHEGHKLGLKLLKQKRRPTAVFCLNDHVACGVLQAAVSLGIIVPDQLSVIGFDNDILAHAASVPLTSVRQPVMEMAEAAVETLLALIDGKPAESRAFQCELIVRASTGDPSA